jgi:broad specificity phosphatase PhoE
VIHSDLKVGANITSAKKLRANSGLSFMGMIPLGADFWIDLKKAQDLGYGTLPGFDKHVRRYANGRDLTGTPRGILALDFYGLTADELRTRFPAAYQWLYDNVKPKRDQDKRVSRRKNWWLYGESVPKFRDAVRGLTRYIGTTETAKHRTFVFIESDVLPDQKIRAVVSDDALHLAVLSSAAHIHWALAAGGRLGIGNDPVYNTTRCFEPFPFPDTDTGLTPALAKQIRALGERLDAHRKSRQAAHSDVTITGMYNVLEKLRSGDTLTVKDKILHEHGLVAVLRTLHDELDAAVLAAYGWNDLILPKDAQELLVRVVELNAKRVAQEAAGTVRWLRPEFQRGQGLGEQVALEAETESDLDEEVDGLPVKAAMVNTRPWPSGLTEQIKAVAEVLAQSGAGLERDAVAAHFSGRGRWRDRLPTLLETLAILGRARVSADGRWTDAGR